VYIGGGTPTSLGADGLCSVISLIKDSFSLSDDCEFTIEANPGTACQKDLSLYRKAGVNRISFGVQSANDRLLKRIGRIHTFKEAADAILWAKEVGFSNISADLMYALPDQSATDLFESIDRLAELPLTHVSMYGLKVEANTPFGRDDNLALPLEEAQCEMYLEGVKRLEQYGFLQYEISNFAKKGYESRHNLKYWKRDPYLGLGCAAHSFFEGKRFFAPCDLTSYCAQQDFSLEGGFYDITVPDEEDERVERVMLSLRIVSGMEADELYFLCKATKKSASRIYLDTLIGQGYAKTTDGFFSLTPQGMLVSNSILSQLMLYME
jgi:oxygen-independent coproporphyrinogen-3 oxidase